MTFTQESIDRYVSDCARFTIEEAEMETWLLLDEQAREGSSQVATGIFATPFAAMAQASALT
jgi:hypothetical protein